MIASEDRPSLIVPRDIEENLRFRRGILDWCATSEEARKIVVAACTRDPMFFCNTFVWVQDVRRWPDCPDRPFIVWNFQRDLLNDIEASIGKKHLGILKSRDCGGSTVPLIPFVRRMIFMRSYTFMVMSRNEKLVDDASNPDSLFYKMDYMVRMLPGWMTRSLDRKKLTYQNMHTGSNIIGSSSTSDAGRGGRKHAILIDEHAAWERKESRELLASVQHNTRCCIFASTPKGIGNGFHEVISGNVIDIHRLHWSSHPVHSAGLYTTENGKPKIIDEAFWRTATPHTILSQYPELKKVMPPSDGLARLTYPFQTDGKLRSPYYDHACLICPIPKLIAQELDMDFIGSGSPFFDSDEIRNYVATICREPNRTGELKWDDDWEKIEFAPSPGGRLALWFHVTARGMPSNDRVYVIGCDVSAGTGASNSVISVGDCRLRCKCATFVTPHLRPERFAEYAFAISRWFGNAKIVFEGQGAGSDFGQRLIELGHKGHLHYMTRSSGTKSDKPGFFSEGESKRNLLTEYNLALSSMEITNYDRVAVEECQMYEFTDRGTIEHVDQTGSADPSGAKKNHGDRVMADALMWMLMKRVKRPDPPEVIQQNRMTYVRQQIEDQQRRRGEWSPAHGARPWCLARR